jgi:signal peptidase I
MIFLKRVIALPGESVALTDGAVVVQGVTQHEDYNPMHDRSNMHVTVVPAGSVFVLGDNRAESDDSRSFGPVSQSSIIGKALFVIWPLGHVKRIH